VLPPITTALAQLTADVALMSVARGDVLYRGTAKWNNLAAGTSGFFLQSNGAGADPSWASVPAATPGGSSGQLQFNSASTFGGAAALTYATSGTHLTITAAADATIPLDCKAKSVTQSGELQRWLKYDGTVLGSIQSDGAPHFPTPSNPTYGTRIGIGSDAGSGNWTVALGRQATITGARDYTCALGALTSVAGDRSLAVGSGASITADGGVAVGSSATAGQNAFALGRSCTCSHTGSVAIGFSVSSQRANEHRFSMGSTGYGVLGTAMSLGGVTSTTADMDMFLAQASWATSTHASRKARVTFSAYDFNAARECIRIEASGSAPMVGFLGAAAVVQQTLAAAATDPATTQTLANSLRTALINLGLGA
jgi:hypothetical protein